MIYDSRGTSYRTPYKTYEGFGATEPFIESGGPEKDGQLSMKSSYQITHNVTATTSYKKEIGKHNFNALAGYEMILLNSETFSASRYGFEVAIPVLDNGNEENDSNSGTASQRGLLSYFGRLSYRYDDKYLLEANYRRDGSSRFAPEQRWGNFPSFSAGWVISNEDFFPENSPLNRLKLRASWGQLGNQNIGSNYFPYASLIDLTQSNYANGEILPGAAQTAMANYLISWETAETTNIGLDFGLFNDKLSGTFEYYKKDTKDLLGKQEIPYSIGLSSPVANVYSMSNKGIDFQLEWRHSIGDVKYYVSGVVATVDNEITDLNGVDYIISGNTINQVGEAAGSIYGYKALGIFQTQDEINSSATQFGTLEPGDIKYQDQLTIDTDGDKIPDATDGVIDSDDRVILGNPFATLTFGFLLANLIS